ncbi:MAG: dihydroorotase, partial [Lachnospiraceae bacterium]|nr:dihydroorotase [Lachnospiraceae bacterium]
MKNLLIKNAKLLDPVTGNDRPGCIGIKNGRIAEIKDDMSSEGYDETVDAKGLVCTPALCDVHVHFRDPGQTYK